MSESLVDAVVEIAQRIRGLRERRGLSQRALAAKAGLDSAAISRIEAGQAPSFSTLHKLAEAFDISVSSLVEPDPINVKILDRVSALGDRQKQYVMLLLEDLADLSIAHEKVSVYGKALSEVRDVLGISDEEL